MPPGSAEPSRIVVAEVRGAHGIRGLLRVHAYNPDSPQLAADRAITLEHHGAAEPRRIASVTRHGRGLLLALDGVTTRTDAERLAGARLTVDAADLPPLEADEFYHHEVLGAEVTTEDGRVVGRIEHTMSTGLNEVWVVRDGAREHLIPVVADVVVDIDRAARRVVIRTVPGLLD